MKKQGRERIEREREYEDMIFGILLIWTVVGVMGAAFGLHIGWWDILSAMGFLPPGWLPADPRYS